MVLDPEGIEVLAEGILPRTDQKPACAVRFASLSVAFGFGEGCGEQVAAVLDDLPECILAQKKFVLIDPLKPQGKRRVLGVRKPFLGWRLDRSGGEPGGEDHADPRDESTPKTITLAVHGATLRGNELSKARQTAAFIRHVASGPNESAGGGI